jgi:hypothetical protein
MFDVERWAFVFLERLGTAISEVMDNPIGTERITAIEM